MSRNDHELEQLLDQAIGEMRDTQLDGQDESAIADRVWARVGSEADQRAATEPGTQQIRDCQDFQALIPAHIQGALSEARGLLLQDHLNECVPCRRVLKQERTARGTRPAAKTSTRAGSSWYTRLGLQVAAAAILVVAVVGAGFQTDLFSVRFGGVIHVEAIEGELFRVSRAGTFPIAAGERVELAKGENLRTGKGSRAMIRLDDESQVEINERSELAVYNQSPIWNRSDRDSIVDLERGSMIIDAANLDSGQLMVDTPDSRMVTDQSVFAVNRGIKGTRVTVLDGRLAIDGPGQRQELNGGQQMTTSDTLGNVPIAQEIAWSGNVDQHLALLRDLNELSREIDRVMTPGLRNSSALLELTPPETVFYVGIPNVSGSLGEAYDVLQQRIAASDVLQGWWQSNIVASGGDEDLEELIDQVRNFGDHLGEEVVVTMSFVEDGPRCTTHPHGSTTKTRCLSESPLILAKLESPEGFRTYLNEQLGRLDADDADDFEIIEGVRPLLANLHHSEAEAFVWIRDDLLIVTADATATIDFARHLDQVEYKQRSGLQERVARLYDDGVEWVLGVDLEAILQHEIHPNDEPEVRGLGFLDMQYVLAEHKVIDGKTQNRGTLTFSQERRGLAALLDEPAAMGALDFVSPEATIAAGVVMQEPASFVDELFGILASVDDNFEEELARFEQDLSIDVRQDFAAPLGGEFAFAVDGPLLPTPSWKLILEVYNPEQLQRTMSWLIDHLNQEIREAGKAGFRLTEEQSGGRTYYQIESIDVGMSAHYLFADGYMIAGPSRALLDRALRTRESGNTLPNSTTFTGMLPADGQVNFSAVVYQNLAPMTGPLMGLGNAAIKLDPQQQRVLKEIGKATRPSMTVAYGAPDSISVVYTHEGGLFSGLGSFLSLRSMMDVQELLGDALREAEQQIDKNDDGSKKPATPRNQT